MGSSANPSPMRQTPVSITTAISTGLDGVEGLLQLGLQHVGHLEDHGAALRGVEQRLDLALVDAHQIGPRLGRQVEGVLHRGEVVPHGGDRLLVLVAADVLHLLEKPIKPYELQLAVRAIVAKYMKFARKVLHDPEFAALVAKFQPKGLAGAEV